MSPPDELLWQRWDDVDRLLSDAINLPADDRDAFVRSATEGDAPLRELVLRLVDRLRTDADARLTPRDDVVLAAFSGDHGNTPELLEPGAEVDRYRIIRRLGRGGMATVYEAERSDGAYEQRVALKILRRGLDTEDLVRRFLTERQILSTLSHPNIGRLLDGGSTLEGRPFLVMELVNGDPITVWADNHSLDIPARLKLFLAVADAVHAAHRQLVVHRDLKPSNVMVDAEGRVKLLDFGIAKLLAEDSARTEAGARALTPDYASPEQIRGDAITTGTDVYQLGLLLRELLTGLPPLTGVAHPGEPPLRPSRGAEMAIKGAPPPDDRAKARRTSSARLARTLRGDLDIIVGKAVRPEPGERYASADELATDVQRYLRGQPIQAHPESVAYRMRKFAGRHPFFLPGALTGALAILVFTTVLGLQNRRIGRERDAAEAASRRALATQEFLVQFLRSPDPLSNAPDPDITVAEALQRGRARIASELDGQPDVKVALLEAIGRTFSGLGRYETADTLLLEALRIQQDRFGADDVRLADVVDALGENSRNDRDFPRADSLLGAELRLRTGAGSVADTMLARLLVVLSGTRRDLGDADSALALATRAVSLYRTAGDSASPDYIGALGSLGYALRGKQQLDAAEDIYREVLRRQQALSNPNPYDLAVSYNNLGYLLRLRGNLAEAEQAYRRALQIASDTLGEGHPATLRFRSNLLAVLELSEKLDEVVVLGREQIAAAEHEWPRGHWRVGDAYLALGRFLLRHDRAAEALEPLRAGVRSYVATLGAGHIWTAVAQADLGTALLLTGHAAEGNTRLDRAYAVLQKGRDHIGPDAHHDLERATNILEQSGLEDWAARFRQLLSPK
jgi:eukaryotic-like serine/threonine-protein kinase